MNKVVFYHLSFDAVADYVSLAITTASKIEDYKRAMSRHFRRFGGNSWLITSFKLENGNVEFRSGERDFNEKNQRPIRSFDFVLISCRFGLDQQCSCFPDLAPDFPRPQDLVPLFLPTDLSKENGIKISMQRQ